MVARNRKSDMIIYGGGWKVKLEELRAWTTTGTGIIPEGEVLSAG